MWLLVAGLALAAVVTAWSSERWIAPDNPVKTESLIILLVLATLGVVIRERGLGPHWGVSIATVVLAATIPLGGAYGAALVGGLAYLADPGARTLRTRLFNVTMTAAVGAVGGTCYALLGGSFVQNVDFTPRELLLRVGVPLAVAYVVMALVNALCIGAMSFLVRGTRVLTVARSVLSSLGWGYLAHAVTAFLFVVLWGPVGLGPASAVFVLGPLLVAHWTIGRDALARREHQETVTTFVAALEQADPASVGHSARVADVADALGAQLGLSGEAAEELRYAALLHDIGMMVVRSEFPHDPDDEIAYLTALSAHPSAGLNVLAGLDFLEESLPAIAHHHERWDGRGYPAGLQGEQIPLAARIIAVADAFDALMAPQQGSRVDPLAVAEELGRRAGTHLDPTVVSALHAALARPGGLGAGQASRPAPCQDRGGLPDHDHPGVSDLFADWQPENVGQA
ncbi:GAF domain/HD domain protein [Serinicoccus hydrothermalis]|uniref:GAF domain/HD domain protein n=1 Tax=Serinicoccus hydrothermalis TaxID=1758689 RepID=A0A1B1NG96_9MICO|nr:HD domain-containing phosphohydrolase [Serinicoccus hydrothermalis]ANS80442.1 GAF domain/HD domain protein [Serinicoccus hydrothermalis]